MGKKIKNYRVLFSVLTIVSVLFTFSIILKGQSVVEDKKQLRLTETLNKMRAYTTNVVIERYSSECIKGEEDLVFYPMPGCSQFYQCVGGVKSVYTCQEGLLFSFSLQSCDYPENVNCNNQW